jgi:Na+/melibiose symporter-like transporter
MADRLNLMRKLSYGVGHVLNDLCASMWFSYLLIYLHRVLLFNDSLAGYMMLLGEQATKKQNKQKY